MPGVANILEHINPIQYEQNYLRLMNDTINLKSSDMTCETEDWTVKRFDFAGLIDTSEDAYAQLIRDISQREAKTKGSHSSALFKAIVSRNRLRYTDADFNLDLSYITNRVIAMGYPGSGLKSLVRNNLDDVLVYFKRYHGLKLKIYNMCNDKFVDPNVLEVGTQPQDEKVRLAYFPMMDHNPGPLPIIWKFIVDAVLYLAGNQDSLIAVHCKAGKGRTGLVICSLFIFLQ